LYFEGSIPVFLVDFKILLSNERNLFIWCLRA